MTRNAAPIPQIGDAYHAVPTKAAANTNTVPAAPPAHPGEILAEMLDAIDMSRTDAAIALAIPRSALHKILGGSRSITAENAVKLGFVFSMSPVFWLNLQRNRDLWHALRSVKTDRLKKLNGHSGESAAR